MYELSENDKAKGGADKLQKSADWDGPIKERSCTDPLFLVGLICAWIFMSYIGIVGSNNGHLDVILNGYSSSTGTSSACGGETPYWYPINYYADGVIGTCVSTCPTSTDTNQGYCINDGTWNVNQADTLIKGDSSTDVLCMPYIQSVPVMNRCFFTEDSSIEIGSGASAVTIDLGSFTEEVSGDAGMLTSFFSDISVARNWIFGFGFCIALVLSFMWCYILKMDMIVDLFIWICCFAISGFGVILGGMMYNTSTTWENQTPKTKNDLQIGAAQAVAIICLVLAFLWLCMLCALRKQITLAIGLVKVTAQAVLDMPAVIFYPLLQLIGFILFLIPWVFYCVLTASMGTFSGTTTDPYSVTPLLTVNGASTSITTFKYGAESQSYPWILLAILYWSVQFIAAIGQITLGIIFSTWYFTRDKSTLGSGEVCDAIKASFKHAGTAAFGALIIAIIQMIRSTIAYFQRQAKQSGKIGQVFQYILCAIQCCVWCLECCMKFLNKNAYIQTAIFGTSFCTSAKAAFFLIARNILRIGAVSMVSEMVIVVGKLFIALISAGLSYYCMNSVLADDISSPIGPAILVFIIGWCTADMFTDIFSMAISVLLQCFIADEEMFEDNPTERFASEKLKEYIDANPLDLPEPDVQKETENNANAL